PPVRRVAPLRDHRRGAVRVDRTAPRAPASLQWICLRPDRVEQPDRTRRGAARRGHRLHQPRRCGPRCPLDQQRAPGRVAGRRGASSRRTRIDRRGALPRRRERAPRPRDKAWALLRFRRRGVLAARLAHADRGDLPPREYGNADRGPAAGCAPPGSSDARPRGYTYVTAAAWVRSAGSAALWPQLNLGYPASCTSVAPSPPSRRSAGAQLRTSEWRESKSRTACRTAPVPWPWMMRTAGSPASTASSR